MRTKPFFYLLQISVLFQHVVEPTMGEDVLDIVLPSQKEFVDNVKIYDPRWSSNNFDKGTYKDMRKY